MNSSVTQTSIDDQKKMEKLRSLIISPAIGNNSKRDLFMTLFNLNGEYALDVLASMRDCIPYLTGDKLLDILKFLELIGSCDTFPVTERMVVATQLYNNSSYQHCYAVFISIINTSTDLDYKLDCGKFLFSSGDERNISITKDLLISTLKNHDLDCSVRYRSIVPYFSNKGIKTSMNFHTLKIPYDEAFVSQLQLTFFFGAEGYYDERDEVILSGQHLLQMSSYTISPEIRKEIQDKMLSIALDENNPLAPNSADVLLRLGDLAYKKHAREIITLMGRKRSKETNLPATIYDDSQNVHSSSIEGYISSFIESITERGKEDNFATGYNILESEIVFEQINKGINAANILSSDKKLKIARSLSRVMIDTSTFGSSHSTPADILAHVWSRIHSDEFSESTQSTLIDILFDELERSNGLCSSGYVANMINVFSCVDEKLCLSWFEQLKSNFKGRMLAKIRDCEDEDIKNAIVLGTMLDASEEDSDVYVKFLKTNYRPIYDELYDEFVREGYIPNAEFSVYMESIISEWLPGGYNLDFNRLM